MKRLQFKDYQSLSRAAAARMLEIVCENPLATFCLATGSTPTGAYEELIRLAKDDVRRFDGAQVVKLDEWGGLANDDPATCETYLRKYFVGPLEISDDRFISFDAAARDPQSECDRVSELLKSKVKQIDLSVLGLGINGHLGFNEPAERLKPFTHVAALTEQTQAHPMVEQNECKPSFGFTLGMADLLQSKEIMILVSGAHKLTQLQRLLDESLEPGFPASFLHLHPNVTLYCDIDSKFLATEIA